MQAHRLPTVNQPREHKRENMMTAYKEAILYLVPLFLIVTGCDIFNSDDDDGGDGPAGDARVKVSKQLTPFLESYVQKTSPATHNATQYTESKLNHDTL